MSAEDPPTGTGPAERPAAPERRFDAPVLAALAIYGACLVLVLVLYHFQ